MAEMYEIAVVGDRESIMGFRAIGLSVYPVFNENEARAEIHRLAESNCAVIFLTETLAKNLTDVIARYRGELKPAIILIPGKEGSLGIGKDTMQSVIERAVGADII
jgi:V/A-type H+-transporting ATPase subunit F